MNCTNCPRHCAVDRTVARGFCQAGPQPEAATVCVHRGEEPPLCGEKGICNVFFSHCNLQCIYCQNYQISSYRNNPNNLNNPNNPITQDNPPSCLVGIEAIADRVAEVLPQTENIVGLVTPSHYADSIPALVEALHSRGLFPTIVYNTGGYDSVETLRALAPYIDIYLPDFKYMDPALALRYSHAEDYPEVALAALKEMYYQKGSALPTDDNGIAYRGIIVRHLVLPGQVENSLAVLDAIADISLNLHVALMAQYFPPFDGLPDQLGRTLTADEYRQVTDRFHSVGLHRGWLQELDAQACYRPDFSRQQAFEK